MAADYQGTVAAYEENLENGGPVGPPLMSWVAAAYSALGRKQEADQLAGQVADRFPGFGLTNWNFLVMPRRPEDRRRMHDLMRDAGLPD